MNYRLFIKLLLTLITLTAYTRLHSQNKAARALIIQKTDTAKLNQLSQAYRAIHIKENAKVLEWAKEKGIPLRYETEEGDLIELQRIDKRGHPIYFRTHNKNAAATTSTNKVNEGGDNLYELSGKDMIAGVWDGGVVYVNHIEFSDNGLSRVSQNDAAQTLSDHATHVTGTIAAKGIEPAAKGMAFNSTVHSYDWNNDLSEMSNEAANGLLLSNHSYGTVTGWNWNGSDWEWVGDESISTTEDYRFGFYTSSARSYDVIARNAPYYLIVKSAGNDRGDGPSDAGSSVDGGYDGFDCISSAGNAKNILSIGATADMPNGYTGNPEDVRITSFSSFGPSDDGRIKPDICGNGQGLYSTSADASEIYNSKSGTSMSAPNVTGSLLLLQEYYFRQSGEFMKAASLKALVLHTADEAGEPGPDYTYGWGLLNTESAARLISHNGCDALISEHSYEGNAMNLDFYSDGTKPLVFTIVWTDPPGSPPEASLNPRDKMLVNDLNIKAVNSEEAFFPYILDVEKPYMAAKTGVNAVDNVEKIHIETPLPGLYTLEISHSGNILHDTQDFSLIVSGIDSNCAANLETDSVGYSAVSISWESNANNDPVLLAASNDNIFGSPENGAVYTAGNMLSGGGEILYFNNNLDSFLHENLRASNSYYYKAWVQKEDGSYTPGIPIMFRLPDGNPKNFSAGDSEVGQISLNWKLNNRQHEVLLAKSDTGTFGTPEDGSLPYEGEIPGGGTICASGNITEYTDTNLAPETKQYYKIWSYIDGSYYSTGDSVLGTTKPLPRITDQIYGTNKVYSGSLMRYSVPDIDEVEFMWKFPDDWSASGKDNIIYATVGRKSGQISVRASENGYEGPAVSMPVEVLKPEKGELAEYGINMFPNPIKEETLKISFTKKYEEVNLTLRDVRGSKILARTYNEPLTAFIDIPMLQAGTYIVEILINKTIQTKSVLIVL
jgi:hypothetical protein